ncbi:hypothetical protein GQ600_21611 [Phytophthora cactorum]|nr:hypothetical protein GQ600_21611 [Phytophthora cactorum]
MNVIYELIKHWRPTHADNSMTDEDQVAALLVEFNMDAEGSKRNHNVNDDMSQLLGVTSDWLVEGISSEFKFASVRAP